MRPRHFFGHLLGAAAALLGVSHPGHAVPALPTTLEPESRVELPAQQLGGLAPAKSHRTHFGSTKSMHGKRRSKDLERRLRKAGRKAAGIRY